MRKTMISVLAVAVGFAIYSYLFIDRDLARWVAKDPHHIKEFFRDITFLGRSEFYLITTLIIYLFYKSKNELMAKKSIYLFWTVALSGLFIIVVKFIVARYRPVALLEDNLYGFTWFDLGYRVNSCPSGHSTTVFSFFVALSLLLPKFRVYFLLFAFLIAFSRVGVDAHYLSDVVLGGVVGTLFALYLHKKIFKV